MYLRLVCAITDPRIQNDVHCGIGVFMFGHFFHVSIVIFTYSVLEDC